MEAVCYQCYTDLGGRVKTFLSSLLALQDAQNSTFKYIHLIICMPLLHTIVPKVAHKVEEEYKQQFDGTQKKTPSPSLPQPNQEPKNNLCRFAYQLFACIILN